MTPLWRQRGKMAAMYYDHQTVGESMAISGPDGECWTQFTCYDWWETFGPDGRRYSTGATREAAIKSHRISNTRLQDAATEINHLRRERGTFDTYGEYVEELTPVHGVRHVVRWEHRSGFERSDSSELLDGA